MTGRKAPPHDFKLGDHEPAVPKPLVKDATREAFELVVRELAAVRKLSAEDRAKWKSERGDSTLNFFCIAIERLFFAVAQLALCQRLTEAHTVLGLIDALLVLAEDEATTVFFVSQLQEYGHRVAGFRRDVRPLNRLERDAMRAFARKVASQVFKE